MTIRPNEDGILVLLVSAWADVVWSGVALIFPPPRREAGVGTLPDGGRLPGLRRAGSLCPLLISAATFAGIWLW